MSNANVSRIGQVNQANDVDALFLKVYAGEVLTAFAEKNMFMEKTTVRSISNGKSAQFPVTGKVGSAYHTPGNEILGLDVNHAERIITIDGLLISHTFIANIDEAMNHYDVRSIYSTEMGNQLAKQMDINIASEIILTSRASATVTDGNGGTTITNDDFKNDGGTAGSSTVAEQATALASGIFAAAEALDEKDVPEDNRYLALRPAEYYVLAQNTDLINRDFGGMGAISEGSVLKVAGITILKSNNVPSTDTTSNTYHGVDASKTVGIVWHPSCTGTVKLLDLGLESQYDVRRQGTLMVAKYAVGHGILRPEAAVELKLGTLSN